MQKIGKAASGKTVNFRRGQAQRAAIERTHGLRCQLARLVGQCKAQRTQRLWLPGLRQLTQMTGEIGQIFACGAQHQLGILCRGKASGEKPFRTPEIERLRALDCAKIQPLSRCGKNVIDAGKLTAQTAVRRGRNTDAEIHQARAFAVGQQAAILGRSRETALIRAEKEQILRVTAALGHQIAHAHAVKAGRNAADGILPERRAEHCEKFLRRAHTPAQNAVGLLEHLAERAVKLCVFLRTL